MVEKKVEKKKKEERVRPVWVFKCHASLLKKIVKHLGGITTEIPLKVTKAGVDIAVVDPAQVMMGAMNIPKKEFSTGVDAVHKQCGYSLNVDEYEFGVDVDKLRKRLSLFGGYDEIDGRVENNVMFLDCDNVHAKLTLLDTRGLILPKMPDNLSFDIVAKVKVGMLKLLCRTEDDDSYLGDYLTLNVEKGRFSGIREMDKDMVKIDLAKNVKTDGKSLYSVDYFKNLLVDDTYSTIELLFGVDSPLQVKGEFGDHGSYMYLLAPRIESE